jgi:hypothetical protein
MCQPRYIENRFRNYLISKKNPVNRCELSAKAVFPKCTELCASLRRWCCSDVNWFTDDPFCKRIFRDTYLILKILWLAFCNSIEMTNELSGQADFRLKLDARLHTGQQYNENKVTKWMWNIILRCTIFRLAEHILVTPIWYTRPRIL